MNKQIFSALKVSVLAIVISFGISYALAWTAPTAPPPTGNVSAPINTGSASSIQTMLGKLIIGDTTTDGDLCIKKAGISKCLSDAQLALPVITITATKSTIQDQQSTTISWSATNTDTSLPNPCTASGSWSGAKMATGGPVSTGILSGVGGPVVYTYTLSCIGPGGTISASTQVQVYAPYSAICAGGIGTCGAVPIPNGVTIVKIKAKGGNGGSGGNTNPCGGNGGDASFAYYGAKIPIVVAGGGGGAACLAGGAAGGYTGSSIHGAGAGGLYGEAGGGGGAVSGGSGGAAGAGVAGIYTILPGGTGGQNVLRSDGGVGTVEYLGLPSPGGSGGMGLINNGLGGARGGWYAGGGGGGLAGGGGGASINYRGGGGGGGGSGYIVPGYTGPDVNGFVTVPLSTISNPATITLYGGGGGYITISW